MAHIVREKSYIANKRKKAAIQTLLWCSLLFIVFFAGIVLNNGSRASYFTVIAAVMALPVAQNLVALIAYGTITKSNPLIDKKISNLPDNCAVFIDNIAVTEKANIPIDYVIVTAHTIFILADFGRFNYALIDSLKTVWLKKGIDMQVNICDIAEWDTAIENAKNSAQGLPDCADGFYVQTIKNLLL